MKIEKVSIEHESLLTITLLLFLIFNLHVDFLIKLQFMLPISHIYFL